MAKKDPEPTKKAAQAAPKTAATADTAAPATDPATGAIKKKSAQPVPIHGPDSLIDRLQPHIKKIAVGALALFGVIGIYVGWRWMKHRKDGKNTAQVDVALQIARARVVAPTDKPVPATPDDDDKTYPTAKDRAAAAADAMAKAGKAADANGLFQAGLLLDAGKLDEAEAIYKAHAGDAGVDGVLAREGVGYVLEARAEAASDEATKQKLYADALDAYKQVQLDDKGPRRDFALYDQARMLQAIGKKADAKAALDSALKAVPKTALKSEIEARQALLEAP